MNLVGLDVIKSASRNIEILGEGYASSVHLQKMSENIGLLIQLLKLIEKYQLK